MLGLVLFYYLYTMIDDNFYASLSDRDLKILTIEKQWWRYTAAKERAVREQLGLSATQYYLALNALLDNPAAAAAEPMLVNRLRAKREAAIGGI